MKKLDLSHKVKLEHFRIHETKKSSLKRFIISFSVFLIYASYLVFLYGTKGLVLGLITWSAFVLATPLADGGLLLDLPIRVFSGIRMVYSEMIVWLVAISTNIYFINFNPNIYDINSITHAFKQILINPWPNWIVIFVSCLGTFSSLYFGDELLDVVLHKDRAKYLKHKKWYRILMMFSGFVIFYISYKYFLLFFDIKL